MIKNKRFSTGLVLLLIIAILASCDERNAQKGDDIRSIELDSTKSTIINVEGSLFSIPSPIQTASLIDRNKNPYRVDMLGSHEASRIIASRNMKALNLGLLGIDMVYCSYYDDGQNAINYYKIVDDLAENLEVKGAIDKSLIERIASNLGNTDSLIYLSGSFYEAADVYLKSNSRPEVAILVLTGAWIESAMLTSLSDDESAKEILASQQQAISTLREQLPGIDFDNRDFEVQFDSLNTAFQHIENTYKYAPPEVYPDQKRSIIKSTSTYSVNDSLRNDIQARLIRLHNIING